ncbi:MAG: DUF3325 domain-containing protein [Pseudomonadota bacterium]
MAGLISFLLAFLGFAYLCAAMPKHQREIFGEKLTIQISTRMKRVGWILITIFLIWTMFLFRWDFGLVIACGVATLCTINVILILTLKPKGLQFLHWSYTFGRKTNKSEAG